MAVAYDTATEDVRTGTASPQTFSHAGAASNVRGVVVALVHGTTSVDHVSAVSYGGVALSRVVRATDTVTEAGAAELWFVGSGLSSVQGTRTVSYTPGGTSDDIHAVCITLTGNADLYVVDSDSISENATNPSVTLQYSGRNSIAIAALYGGGASPASFTPNANCVTVHDHDLGAFYSEVIRQSTPGVSDFAIGGTAAGDDVAYVAIAVTESNNASPATGTVVLSGQTPTVGIPKFASPGTGTLRISGQAPVIGTVRSVSVGVASLTTTTYAPDIDISTAASPGSGEIRIAGQQPTSGESRSAWPLAASLIMFGLSPLVVTQITSAPGTGTMVVSGQQSVVGGVTETSVGFFNLTTTGHAPTITTAAVAYPGSGTLRTAGGQPTLYVTSNAFSSPSSGDLRVVGQQAFIELPGSRDAYPSSGSLLASGNAPQTVVGVPTTVTISSFALATQAYVPKIEFSRLSTPGSGALRLAGQAASQGSVLEIQIREKLLSVDKPFATIVWTEPTLDVVGSPTHVDGYYVYAGTSPTVLSLYADVLAPTTWAEIRLPSAGTWYFRVSAYNDDGESDLSLIETVVVSSGKFPPAIRLNPGAEPGSGTLVMAGNQPQISDRDVANFPSAGTVRAEGQQPTVRTTRSSSPGVGSVRIVGQPIAKGVVAGSGTLRFVEQTPIVTAFPVSRPETGTVRIAGQAPTVTANTDKFSRPGTESVRMIGLVPLVYAKVLAYPGTGDLRVVGKRPAVSKVSPTEGKWFERLTVYSVLAGTGNWFEREAWAFRDTELYADHWSERQFATVSVPKLGEGTPRSTVSTASGVGRRGVVDVGSTVEVIGNVATLEGEGTLTYAGYGIRPQAGTLRVSGNAPDTHVALGPETRPGSGSLLLVEQQPTVRKNAPVYAGSGTLHLEGNAASTTPAKTGTGALQVPSAIISRGEGTINAPGTNWRANGGVRVPLPTVEGQGTLIPRLAVDGTGDLIVRLTRMTGVGTLTRAPLAYRGDGALVAPTAQVSGRSRPNITGYGNLITPHPRVRIKAWVHCKKGPKGWTKKPTGDEIWTIVNTAEEDWNG